MNDKEETAAAVPAEQMVDEILRNISYRQVLLALFTNPLRGIVFACGKSSWLRGILLLTGIGILGAGAGMLTALPGQAEEFRRAAEFLGANLGEVSFAGGRLRHARTLARPVRGHFSFGRIDLLAQGQGITDSLLAVMGGDRQGMIVADDRIVLWRDVGEVMPFTDGRSASAFVGRLGQLQRQGVLPESISPEYLAETVPRMCYLVAPFLAVANGLGRAALMVFYALLLCMLVGSIRRSFDFFPGSSFVFALHAVVVPFVVAMVYSACIPERLSFEPAFWTASIGYLAYAVWEVKTA